VSTIYQARARLGAHDRWHPDDSETRATLLADLRLAMAEDQARELAAKAAPLTAAQRARIVAIVLDGGAACTSAKP
jgi:hypothetical protein